MMVIDAHAHVDRFEILGAEVLSTALEEIESHKILTISNSMDPASYERNREIAKGSEYILPIFGVHPWIAGQYVDRLDSLDTAIESSPMLGELGLDTFFVDDESEYPKQREVLEYFFAAAKQQNKIVNLHTLGAEKIILDLLIEFELQRVIIHWYAGPLDIFEKLAGIGCYFTVGVEVMFSEHMQTIARSVPSDRLLTETDNPGGPTHFLGRPGTPLLIDEIVDKVADLRSVSNDELVDAVQSNLMNLIGDDPWFQNTNLALLFEKMHRKQ